MQNVANTFNTVCCYGICRLNTTRTPITTCQGCAESWCL